MSRNVNVNDGRYNQVEIETALTVPAGGSFTVRQSEINTKNENQGLKVDGQDEIVIFVAVTGTMPVDSEVVITPIVHGFPALDPITVLLPTVTDNKIEGRLDSSVAVRDADFLKVTYRFKQGGADYDVTALGLQVKKKPSIAGVSPLAPTWIFDITTADANPGAGKFRLNNAVQASSTFLYVNNTSYLGVLLANVLLTMSSGDRVLLQVVTDPTKFLLCNLSANVINGTTYVKIPMTVTDSGLDFVDGDRVDFELIFSGGISTHALGGSQHSADTIANLNSKISDGNVDKTTAARPPLAHAATHEGGSDPLSAAGIGAEPTITPKNTAFNKNFGSASGTVCQGDDARLSDARPPTAHGAAAHTGAIGAHSQITSPGANDHHNQAHDLGGVDHNTATLAQLNAKISDNDIVGKTIYDANTMLKADSDNTPTALTVNASTIVGRKATGPIAAMSPGEARSVLALPSSFSGEKNEFLQVNEAETAVIVSGIGHWGTKIKTDMEAITGARDGDTCFCSTYGKMFWYNSTYGLWLVPGEMLALVNQTGGARTVGQVVIQHGSIAYACDGTTSSNDLNVVGPIITGKANGSYVSIAIIGGPWPCSVIGAAGLTDGVGCSTTEFSAAASAFAGPGIFAQCLNSKGVGTANLDIWLGRKEIY